MQHDELNLEKRIEELEINFKEMLERMRQYEAVMTTAFRLCDAGEWRTKKNKEIEKAP